MPIQGYISEAVAGGALLCLWLGIRNHRAEQEQTIKDHKEEVNTVVNRAFNEIEKVRETSMTNRDHANVCKINTLEVKAHISDEMKLLGDILLSKMDGQAQTQRTMFESLARDVVANRSLIDRLDKRTVHLKDVDR